MSSSKIAVYSLADLKNTTDDALPNYLNSIKFDQSHLLTDIRLVLGYSAVALAAATFYFDYKLGWDDTKDYTFWAVVVYFTLNSALTLWIWAVEKGNIYSGNKGKTLISIASKTEKNSPTYRLKVRFNESKDLGKGSGWEEKEIEASFTKWFTADGYFVAKPFQEWLSNEIKPIREAKSQ